MSQTLGPIHSIMFRKIKEQEELANKIIDFFDIGVQLDDFDKPIEDGELAELIGENSIHGWLNERVIRATNRFMGLLRILKDSKKGVEELEKLVSEFAGNLSEKEAHSNVMEVFNEIRFKTLDGMPCDGGLIIEDIDENRIDWKINLDIYQKYSDVVDDFLKIRYYFIEGLVKKDNVILEKIGKNRFRLTYGK